MLKVISDHGPHEPIYESKPKRKAVNYKLWERIKEEQKVSEKAKKSEVAEYVRTKQLEVMRNYGGGSMMTAITDTRKNSQ